jgi:hypothetical protein
MQNTGRQDIGQKICPIGEQPIVKNIDVIKQEKVV